MRIRPRVHGRPLRIFPGDAHARTDALPAREQGDIKSMVEQLKTMENASMQVVHCIDRLLESA